ncbi:MAG: type pilus assembly protein PilX [Burkholderiales bacterium]
MHHTRLPFEFSATQRGSVLVTALIMLVVLTMLMVSAMRTNVGEQRMAGNARDWHVAFQAAEAALRDAERDILAVTRISGLTGFDDGCSNTGLCKVSTTGTAIWVRLAEANDAGWMSGQDSNTKTVKYGAYTDAAALPGVAAQPRYIIEAISVPQSGSIKKPQAGRNFDYFYRVTAVGFGANITTRVMLQGVYRQY